MFSRNFVDILGVSLRVTALFFPMSWPSWGALGGIFGLILGNVCLMLHNCSIFPHEVLQRCSWYNPDGHYAQKLFTSCLFSAGSYFGVFWDLFLNMYIFFQISVQYFLMKFCTGVLGITLIITNTKKKLSSCPALQGDILGYSEAYFGILRLLFENVQYVL